MARTFNGTSDLIGISSLVLNPGDSVLSMSCFIKTSATAGTMLGCDNGSSARFAQFKVAASKLQMILFNSATARSWTSTSNVNTGAWVHCGGACTGTTGVVYVDGSAQGAATQTTTNSSSGLSWRIGAQLAGVTQAFFSGQIAEVALWKRVLSANEFASLSAGLPASHLAPDHYWPLFGADSPEPDIGNVTHATGSLTGTTAAAGARVNSSLLTLNG